MTTEQYWASLDALASSRGTERLLEATDLLCDHPDLPLLISCRRIHGRIHHLFTSFDGRSPDTAGNRYLICFTSEKQVKKRSLPQSKMKPTIQGLALIIWKNANPPASDGRKTPRQPEKPRPKKPPVCPPGKCSTMSDAAGRSAA